MKRNKLYLTGVLIALIAIGAVAAKTKSTRGQGNLYRCTGSPLTCGFTGNLSDVQGTETALPTDNFFTGGTIGSSCQSISVGCNRIHPVVVLQTIE